jgi:hypothetical protein
MMNGKGRLAGILALGGVRRIGFNSLAAPDLVLWLGLVGADPAYICLAVFPTLGVTHARSR